MDSYEDIINLPHHESEIFPRMPLRNRAAQFAPFAALSGHEEALAETARTTQVLKELSEIEKDEISIKLNDALKNHFEIEIKFFVPDIKKTGGEYRTIRGIIKKIDEFEKILYLNAGYKIPLDYINDIVI